MNNYSESKYFLNKVKEKDLFCVKSTIAEMIERGYGDIENKKKIVKEAIVYAKNQGLEIFEEDDGLSLDLSWITKEEERYFHEKDRLRDNFTEKRLDLVFKLYEKYIYKPVNFIENAKKENRSEDIQKKYRPKESIYQQKKFLLIGLIMVVMMILFWGLAVIAKN